MYLTAMIILKSDGDVSDTSVFARKLLMPATISHGKEKSHEYDNF